MAARLICSSPAGVKLTPKFQSPSFIHSRLFQGKVLESVSVRCGHPSSSGVGTNRQMTNTVRRIQPKEKKGQ